jgi:hypothetical protein
MIEHVNNQVALLSDIYPSKKTRPLVKKAADKRNEISGFLWFKS